MAEDKKNSILVVDDESANILTLTHMLRPEYTVYAAKNGHDAIESAAKLLPDMVLLDVLMPDMDGYAVLTALKADKRTCNIPVIFITGLGDVDSERKGLLMGAADYVVKPFVPAIVKIRVGNQIKLVRQMRQLMEKELEERSNNARLEFLMDMSHEMLTPMNSIMGMTQIAKIAKNPDEVQDCLNEIDTASRQLLELIERLLKRFTLVTHHDYNRRDSDGVVCFY